MHSSAEVATEAIAETAERECELSVNPCKCGAAGAPGTKLCIGGALLQKSRPADKPAKVQSANGGILSLKTPLETSHKKGSDVMVDGQRRGELIEGEE